MRTLISLTFLFILCAAPASGQIEPVKPAPPVEGVLCSSETDEFTGDLEVSCEHFLLTVEEHPRKRLRFARALFFENEGTPGLMIQTESKSWNFLDTKIAYALIDGERLEFSFERAENEVNRGSVTEVNYITLTSKDLRRFAEAETFRMKVGDAVFSFPAQPVNVQASYLLNN